MAKPWSDEELDYIMSQKWYAETLSDVDIHCPLCSANLSRHWTDLVHHMPIHCGTYHLDAEKNICPCCRQNFYKARSPAQGFDVMMHIKELYLAGKLLEHMMHSATMQALLGDE